MKRVGVSAVVLGAVLASAAARAEEMKTATLYKPLQCGCCDEYAKYLERNGFKVKVESQADRALEITKKMAGVPPRFAGCHTLLIDGYVVEGLVPLKPVQKLLTERPQITGITLPGMPMGSPGMSPERKRAPLIIYEIPKGSAEPKEFARD